MSTDNTANEFRLALARLISGKPKRAKFKNGKRITLSLVSTEAGKRSSHIYAKSYVALKDEILEKIAAYEAKSSNEKIKEVAQSLGLDKKKLGKKTDKEKHDYEKKLKELYRNERDDYKSSYDILVEKYISIEYQLYLSKLELENVAQSNLINGDFDSSN
ncbi:TPA: hypothetical protein KDZ99_004916 [Vibrio parahaemolyticus]|nr:hypothetical protein [Vibrio parahaemolyticus]HBC3578947.1 hypothetical protein [Vibrio parahaemolyticus]